MIGGVGARVEADRGRFSALRRPFSVARAAWPEGPPGRALAVLLGLGVVLRILACVSLWPTTILEDGYQNFAGGNPFLDALHPAGYALILKVLGAVTRQIAVPIVLQHLSGLGAALLVGAAVRRLTGSAWAGVASTAIGLVAPDEVFLEHSIMSESWQIAISALAFYGAVRMLDEPASSIRWPLLTGLALGVAATVRTASLPVIAVAALALLLAARARGAGARGRWRAPVVTVAAAGAVLIAFAGANAHWGGGARLTPSPGWYLYGRVAQFADCRRFTPPAGTAGLCERRPPAQRPNAYFYEFDSRSPAQRTIGPFGTRDGLIGAWAKRALRAQVGDFLTTAWSYLRSYYVPGSRPARLRSSTGLDPQLDFSNGGNIFFVAAGVQALQGFFDRFAGHRWDTGVQILRTWQVIVRFGATLLFVTTLLTLVGLAVGPPRLRLGVLLFGVGGLSMLAAPVLTGTYSGRYTVPMAGPLLAATAIAVVAMARQRSASRAAQRGR